MSDLSKFLSNKELHHLYDNFSKFHIKTLLELSFLRYTDLIEIGVSNVEDRIKVYEIIRFLRKNRSTDGSNVSFCDEYSILLADDPFKINIKEKDSKHKENLVYHHSNNLISADLEGVIFDSKNHSIELYRKNKKLQNENFNCSFVNLDEINSKKDTSFLSGEISSNSFVTSKSYSGIDSDKQSEVKNICITNDLKTLNHDKNTKKNFLEDKTNKKILSRKFSVINNNFNHDKNNINEGRNSLGENSNYYKNHKSNIFSDIELSSLDNSFNKIKDISLITDSSISISRLKDETSITNIKHDGFKNKISNNTFEDYKYDKNESLAIEMDASNIEKITVCVRKRPTVKNERDLVDIKGNNVTVNELKTRLDLSKYIDCHEFNFDYSFNEKVKNDEIYDKLRGIVFHVLNGGNGTIIAYGQTGTGKTHTIFHPTNGLVFLTIQEWLSRNKSGVISFFEIYNGNIYDLLDFREKIQLREKNGTVNYTNMEGRYFETVQEALEIINEGMSIRRKGKTSTNNESSRSHAILKISFSMNEMNNEGNCLVFVDLAGSERGSDRQNVHNLIRNEGAEINKSLLALKECIRGMDSTARFLPFRQSKLTQVLKNSLTGKSKTVLIATINPGTSFIEHTLNTLRYANRIKESKSNQGEAQNEKTTSKDSSIFTTKSNHSIRNVSSLRSSFIKIVSKEDSVSSLSNKERTFDKPLYRKKTEYKKYSFDSTYIKEKSPDLIMESFHSDKNINEEEEINILKRKVDRLCGKIKSECEGNGDVNVLKKTCEMLKGVEKKIFDMKFK